MANNTVNVNVQVDDNGSLQQVGRSAQSAASGLDNVGRNAQTADRSLKGAAQASSNGTKNFSKMAQGIEGGLVPAYATLAANIFAVTAAFSFFQRSAQVGQLTAGLSEMGSASGLALKSLSNDLIEATGNALTFEEAMRSTAMITSAGLDTSLVADLGKVAKDASIALGRDTADSLARLTRGVTKLEPELLDELGIFVRIDEASANYARSIGKSASELTNFEKRQAFANSVLDQGRQKFAAIGDSVDSNPYDRLAASFQNLTKDIGSFFTGSSVLNGIVGLLADNTTILLAAILSLSGAITGQLITGAAAASDSLRKLASEDMKKFKKASANLFSGSTFQGSQDKALQALNASLTDGRATTEEYSAAVAGQERQIRSATTRMNRHQREIAATRAQLASLNEQNYISIAEHRRLTTQLDRQTNSYMASRNSIVARNIAIATANMLEVEQHKRISTTAKSKALAAIQEGKYSKALRYTIVAMRRASKASRAYFTQILAGTRTVRLFGITINTSNKFVKGFVTGLRAAVPALAGFAVGVKIAGAALLQAIPIVGQIIAVFMLLSEAFSYVVNLFTSDKSKAIDSALEGISETQKELTKNIQEADRAFAGQSAKIHTLTKAYVAQANVLSQFKDKYDDLVNAGADTEDREDVLREMINSSAVLKERFNALEDSSESYVSRAENFIESTQKSAQAVQAFQASMKEAAPEVGNYLNSLVPQGSYSKIISSLSDMQKSASRLNSNTGLTTREKDTIASQELTPQTAQVLGLGSELKAIDSAKEKYKALADQKKKAETELASISSFDYKAKYKAQKALDKITMETFQAKNKVHQTEEGISAELEKRLATMGDILKGVNEENVLHNINLQTIKAKQSLASKTAKFDVASLKQKIALSNQEKTVQYGILSNELELKKATLKNTADTKENAHARAVLEAEILRIEQQQKDIAAGLVVGLKAQLQIRERILEITKQGLEAEKSMQKAQLSYTQSLRGDNFGTIATQNNALADTEIALKQNEIAKLGNKLANDSKLTEEQKANILKRIQALGFNILTIENNKTTAIDTQLETAKFNLKVKETDVQLEEKLLGLKQKQASLAKAAADREVRALQITQETAQRNEKRSKPFGLGRYDRGKLEKENEIAVQEKIAQITLDAATRSAELAREALTIEKSTAALKMTVLKAQVAAANQANGTQGLGPNGLTAEQRTLFGQIESAQASLYTAQGTDIEGKLELAKSEFTNTTENLKDAKVALTDIGRLSDTIGESFESGLGGAFSAIIQGTSSAKDAFASMAKSILANIADIISELLVASLLRSILGGVTTPGASAATSSVGPVSVGSIASSGGSLSLAGSFKPPGLATGGVVSGPTSGFPAELHGTEAVVPLPNGRSIPVEMKDSAGQVNNVNVSVQVDGNGNSKVESGEGGEGLGKAIAAAVQKELQNQKRSGGILNPYGAT